MDSEGSKSQQNDHYHHHHHYQPVNGSTSGDTGSTDTTTVVITGDHNGQIPSVRKYPLRPSGDVIRQKRKLHRCLNKLKHYLSSTPAQSTTPNDPITGQRKRSTMTAVDAVRQAMKLLKCHETKQDRPPENDQVRREISSDSFTKTIDTVHSSILSQYWPGGSMSAAVGDKYDDIVLKHQDTIGIVVSCRDGLIVEASESLYNALQISPATSLLPGRPLVSLFSPNDQPYLVAFLLNTYLTLNVQSPGSSMPASSAQNDIPMTETSFYASLRRCLDTESQVDSYQHCRVVCSAKSTYQNDTEGAQDTVLLSLTALPLSTLFALDSLSDPPHFYTKHSPSCVFLQVDSECVRALGYLPQELIGRSLLSCVSDESLKYLEAAHEQAVKSKGKPIRSKIYHFLLRDGSTASMQSEWSLFVNPWTRETEFVIGYHKVIQRPENAHSFDGECPAKMANQLDARQAKTQAKIQRILAKAKQDRLHSKKPVAAVSSSTTDKDVSSGCANPNGSTDGHTTNSFPSSTMASSKSKGVLNMGVYLDRMVETELFRNSNSATMQRPVNNCKFFLGEGTKDVERPAVVEHHETSPISAAEAISSSPPGSNGSGPTYKEINLKEKVTRFLNSQSVVQSGSSPPRGGKSHHDGYSPSSYHHQIDPHTTIDGGRNPEAIDLRSASIMHRSRSAASDLNHYRHFAIGETWTVPLTSDILRQFTKEKERESKADWKRRYSSTDAPSADPVAPSEYADKTDPKYQRSPDPHTKRATFEQCPDSEAPPPQKLLRLAVVDNVEYENEGRPSSMPVISRAHNQSTEAIRNTTAPSSQWPLRNTVDYYRSLGPTPAPPPGKNFQISSAPLPDPPSSPPLDSFRGINLEKSLQANVPHSIVYRHSAFAPPPPKSSFLTAAVHQSVIQQSPFSPQPAPAGHWLNIPGNSASAILQRMVPKALAREQAEAAASAFWMPPTQPPSTDCTQASFDAYPRGNDSGGDTRPYLESSTSSGITHPTGHLYNEYPLPNTSQPKQTDQV